MILCARAIASSSKCRSCTTGLFMVFIPASSHTAGLDGQNGKKKYQESLEVLGKQLVSFTWKSSYARVSAFECNFFEGVWSPIFMSKWLKQVTITVLIECTKQVPKCMQKKGVEMHFSVMQWRIVWHLMFLSQLSVPHSMAHLQHPPYRRKKCDPENLNKRDRAWFSTIFYALQFFMAL